MKAIFIFLITLFFTTNIFSYEYYFIDSKQQRKVFTNSLPYSSKIESCINTITHYKNYLLVNERELVYIDDNSNLISTNCNDKVFVIKEFKDKIESQIVYKNRLYINVKDSVWVTDGKKDNTTLLKNKLGILAFNNTDYNLYVLEYPAHDELNLYVVNKDFKSLKRVSKGITISSSRFSHFSTPNLYITRMGTLFKMNEITYDVEVVNEQFNVFYPSFAIPLKGKLIHFVSEKGEIYVTYGTKDSTQKIKSFRDTKRDVYFRVHSLGEDKVSFLALDDKRNESLYETDGTIEGTVLVRKVSK